MDRSGIHRAKNWPLPWHIMMDSCNSISYLPTAVITSILSKASGG